MKIALIHYVAGISCKELAIDFRNNGIQADVFRMSQTDKTDFRDYDYVFSYGCSATTLHNSRINSAAAVKKCKNKPLSFEAFKQAQADTVEYTLRKPIPPEWDWVVVRSDQEGRKAEGISYHDNSGYVPDGDLYTEYFEHNQEYRIMVFKGEIVGRYYKHEENGDWYFNLQPAKGFEKMDAHCLRAAQALQVDYVGFDVVAKNKNNFKILEANSAPRLTYEAAIAILEHFINL